ncbi:MAG TPA: response regulator [Candidatus Brocadiaceae bacterium]|nr:response regulator [Candidatus Brocadiaceae bacterium]
MSKRILIIEDEDEFFFFYNIMLEGSDYIVERACNGNEAFDKIKENKPHLIVLDLLLDQMTGEEFLNRLKSNGAYTDIPVIIASSFSPRACKPILELYPHLGFLEKPFTQDQLLAEIRAKIK